MTARLFRSILSLTALAVAVLFAGSCARSHQIAGKWQTTSGDTPMVWEFAGDGSVRQGSVRGRYSFGDNERMKIETPFATTVYQVQIAGDRLTLIDARGAKLDFTRAKEP